MDRDKEFVIVKEVSTIRENPQPLHWGLKLPQGEEWDTERSASAYGELQVITVHIHVRGMLQQPSRFPRGKWLPREVFYQAEPGTEGTAPVVQGGGVTSLGAECIILLVVLLLIPCKIQELRSHVGLWFQKVWGQTMGGSVGFPIQRPCETSVWSYKGEV